MVCYVCAQHQETKEALAVCRSCSVGLCYDHLAELQGYRVGGEDLSCPHVMPKPPKNK
jgi:hypothetical protein